MPESWAVCSIASRPGSESIGSRRRGPQPTGSAQPFLLKGADTLVAAPDGSVVVCDIGPASLATAGTGDVLTGVVASFLSKGLDAPTAAAAAAVAHGRAARLAPHRLRPSLPGISSPRFPLRSTPDAAGGRWRRMTAWSGRASPSISVRFGGTPRRSCAPPVAPSCGPSSRRRGTGTAPSTSPRLRSRRVHRRSASRPCPRLCTSERRCATRASS
jgi:hypothetical protein